MIQNLAMSHVSCVLVQNTTSEHTQCMSSAVHKRGGEVLMLACSEFGALYHHISEDRNLSTNVRENLGCCVCEFVCIAKTVL
jgi:hypothetical protein